MSKTNNRRFLYWASLVIFLYVFYLMVSPYLTVILGSFVVAYIFYPLYSRLQERIKSKRVASFLIATFIIILVTIPSIFLLNSLSREAYIIYTVGQQKITTGTIFSCETSSIGCEISKYFSDLQTRFYLQQALEKITNNVLNLISSFALSIPSILLDLFVVLFVTYYLLISWPEINKKITSTIPYQKKHIKQIVKNFNDVTYAIVYGIFVIGIVEGLLGILAFVIVGATSPVLWGLIIGFLALIPMIGATLIWVPALIIYLYQGMMWQAIVMLVIGIIISSIDTFIKPVIMAGKADINPALMLLGLLGGLSLFGIVGIFLGPLVLSFSSVIFKIYMQERITT